MNNRKKLIKLFIYVLVVVIGIILLLPPISKSRITSPMTEV
ncbi:hypothetical protein [Desulfosporosinus nitroreducens]|nr:hypothetical protein [Desulfosporosinus nitroreducens]